MSHTRTDHTARVDVARDLAQQGCDQVTNSADPRVALAIDAAIQAAIDSGRRFSANDIRDRFPVAHSNLVGARMRSFAYRRVDGRPLMVRVGRTPSTLASTHGHEIAVWLGQATHATLNRP